MALPLIYDIPLLNDFQRSWNFFFTLMSSPLRDITYFSKGSKIFNAIIFNPIVQLYVSAFAEVVTIPSRALRTNTSYLGTVAYNQMQGAQLSNIEVKYAEPMWPLIYWYHTMWQNLYSGKTPGYQRSMRFMEPANISQMVIFTPAYKLLIDAAVDLDYSGIGGVLLDTVARLPLFLELYPRVAPAEIKLEPFDKSSDRLSSTTVSYIRFPDIKRNSAYEYSGGQSSSPAVEMSFKAPDPPPTQTPTPTTS